MSDELKDLLLELVQAKDNMIYMTEAYPNARQQYEQIRDGILERDEAQRKRIKEFEESSDFGLAMNIKLKDENAEQRREIAELRNKLENMTARGHHFADRVNEQITEIAELRAEVDVLKDKESE